ncbi:hypothetical protein AMTRI_Chr04g247380 [Amborella trichopoda]
MKTQKDQIIHPMKKILYEHEYTQNPGAREFHKENDKDCLSPWSMIQERMKEQTSAQEVPIEESNCSQNYETQENDEYIRKISIPIEETSAQKVQDIPVIHVITKENDPIFQISALNRDPEDYICMEFRSLDSAIHEETKESSLKDSVELSLNVTQKKIHPLKNG